MDLGLKDKLALVTASGRGLGRAIASRLQAEGARLIINSRSDVDLQHLLGKLGDGQHTSICMDLAQPGASQKLYDYLLEKDLIPEIMVHNLGGNLNITDPFCTLEDWQKVMTANLYVPIDLNRLIIPHMIKKKWGRICHISSVSALENHGPPSYCAAKAALTAYVRSLGRFVARDGIIMTSVLPGSVFTERGYWDDALKNRPHHVAKYLNERMAIQRFGSPEEIADVVAFLCSQLSSFCVGSAFLVDGGQGRSFYLQEH
jgi:3-oxoacyl-[acyl-carrier protein] reductase